MVSGLFGTAALLYSGGERIGQVIAAGLAWVRLVTLSEFVPLLLDVAAGIVALLGLVLGVFSIPLEFKKYRFRATYEQLFDVWRALGSGPHSRAAEKGAPEYENSGYLLWFLAYRLYIYVHPDPRRHADPESHHKLGQLVRLCRTGDLRAAQKLYPPRRNRSNRELLALVLRRCRRRWRRRLRVRRALST